MRSGYASLRSLIRNRFRARRLHKLRADIDAREHIAWANALLEPHRRRNDVAVAWGKSFGDTVVAMFPLGMELDTYQVHQRLRDNSFQASSTVVRNAIQYGIRTGKLTRTRRGRYVRMQIR